MGERSRGGADRKARRRRTMVGLVLLGAVTANGCAGRAASKKQQAESRLKTVMVEPVGRQDIVEELDYPADILPKIEVKIFSPVPDRIVSFPWNDGDRIRRGQRVALIRKKGLDMGLQNLSAQIDALDIQIKNLDSELERSKKLKAAGAISDQAFDQIGTSLRSSRAQRRALVASRGQLKVSAANASITSPIDGVIADKMLEVGDMASPAMPLCRIIVIDQVKVELKLVESDVPKVKVGQKALITLNAFPERTFEGEVTRILPYLNAATRTNTVQIVLDNPKRERSEGFLVKPGMFGRVRIVVQKREQVITAPERALLLDNRILEQQKPGQVLRKAFVVDGESIARERVAGLGARKGSTYEVLGGLEVGDRIVVRGQHGLRDGQKVEIVEPEQ